MAESSQSWVSTSSSESTFLYSLSCSDHDLSHVNSFDWSRLPEVVIVEIFKFLKDSDRARLALTCKKFSALFKSPCLWRWRSFDFGTSRIAKSESKALGFVNNFGAHLKKLTIKCRHPSYSTCKRFQKVITNLMTALGAKTQLNYFDISGLELDRYWRFEFTREKMLLSLSRFLRGQKMLVNLNLSAGMIQVNSGCRILEAVVQNNGKYVEYLNLEDYFHSRQAVFRIERFINLMSKFTGLIRIHLNYNCISDEILLGLAKTNVKKLQYMSVKVYKSDPHFHKIDGYSWKKLSNSCPSLKVDFDFDQVNGYEEITRALVPQIPLRSLHIWTGYYTEEETWKVVDVLQYITNNFHSKMKKLSLEIDTSPEEYDEVLKVLVVKCKALEKLDVNAALNVDTVEEICQLQLDEKINLHRFHAILTGLTDTQFTELTDIEDEYRPMIYHRRLDFKFTSDLIIGFED